MANRSHTLGSPVKPQWNAMTWARKVSLAFLGAFPLQSRTGPERHYAWRVGRISERLAAARKHFSRLGGTVYAKDSPGVQVPDWNRSGTRNDARLGVCISFSHGAFGPRQRSATRRGEDDLD
jgi:hypothetical protein